MQALSNAARGLPNRTVLKLQTFFCVVDKYCVLCKVQSELSLSEEANIQKGIYEVLNTCNCQFRNKVRKR
jgi:hypothetical protein